MSQMGDIGWLSYEHFAGREGDSFDLRGEGNEPAPLVLVEATESSQAGGTGPSGEQRQQFSQRFHPHRLGNVQVKPGLVGPALVFLTRQPVTATRMTCVPPGC
jgi:hypothetical protein